jgi:hypothetical protein
LGNASRRQRAAGLLPAAEEEGENGADEGSKNSGDPKPN